MLFFPGYIKGYPGDAIGETSQEVLQSLQHSNPTNGGFFVRENPIKMDDDWGFPISGNHQFYICGLTLGFFYPFCQWKLVTQLATHWMMNSSRCSDHPRNIRFHPGPARPPAEWCGGGPIASGYPWGHHPQSSPFGYSKPIPKALDVQHHSLTELLQHNQFKNKTCGGVSINGGTPSYHAVFRLFFSAMNQPFGATPMTSHDYGNPHVMKSTATSPPGGKSVKGIGQGSDGLHHVMPEDYGGNVRNVVEICWNSLKEIPHIQKSLVFYIENMKLMITMPEWIPSLFCSILPTWKTFNPESTSQKCVCVCVWNTAPTVGIASFEPWQLQILLEHFGAPQNLGEAMWSHVKPCEAMWLRLKIQGFFWDVTSHLKISSFWNGVALNGYFSDLFTPSYQQMDGPWDRAITISPKKSCHQKGWCRCMPHISTYDICIHMPGAVALGLWAPVGTFHILYIYIYIVYIYIYRI